MPPIQVMVSALQARCTGYLEQGIGIMGFYIWEHPDWWQFRWESEALLKPLAHARKVQGRLLAKADALGLKAEADFYVEEIYHTSQIEGEQLLQDDIRSSIAERLGLPLENRKPPSRAIEGLVSIMLDIVREMERPLTAERLHGWQAALFPNGRSGLHAIQVGAYRQSTTAMEVISGPMGREKVHYQAPHSDAVPLLMDHFLYWFQGSSRSLDGLLRAAITHFWFVTIHPYEDGNGRLARAICDLALAQDEGSSRRLYSLSAQIMKRRKSYYKILEACQTNKASITEWLLWFLDLFVATLEDSERVIHRSEELGRFYKNLAHISLSERQLEVLRKMLEMFPDEFQGGLNNRKYVAMTGVSSETAKRDLSELVEKGLLIRGSGGGRSVSYQLNRNMFESPI
jgi:Fic family protein